MSAVVLRPCAGEPELFDPAITGEFSEEMASLAGVEQVEPWCSYVLWREGRPVGFGGFKAPPDEAGSVEIGYLTFPAHVGKGVATEVAYLLVAIAREQKIPLVVAHTLPEPNASTRVLEKAGFVRDGTGHDPDVGEVWRWMLRP